MTGKLLAAAICSKNDEKCATAVNSIAPHVDFTYVVDSSSDMSILSDIQKAVALQEEKAELFWSSHASLTKARNLAIVRLRRFDYVVFIDADLVVPPNWGNVVRKYLQHLPKPDVIVGARTHRWQAMRFAEYYAAIEQQHNDDYRTLATYVDLPIDNTVWRTAVFDEIGSFDERFLSNGEDIDIGYRAIQAGLNIVFAPDLSSYHDQSHRESILRILHRRFKYMIGGAMAYVKHDRLKNRPGRRKHYHPIEFFDFPMKVIGVCIAILRLGGK